ncbi:MAG: FtsX-like permease family protein [Pseudomonadales bacterium]
MGIASIVAVHLISARIADELAATTPAHLQGFTHLVERADLSADAYFSLRREWRAGRHPEIRALMPVVDGRWDFRTGSGFTVAGVDALAGFRGTAAIGLLAPGQVVLGTGAGIPVGTRLDGRFEVVATVDAIPDGLLLTDIGTAQVMLGLDEQTLSRIVVSVVNPWSRLYEVMESLLPGFSAGFPPPDWTLPGWRIRAMEEELPSLAFGRSVLFNLGALSSLALLVSWLLVYQVGIIWLRRRRPVMDRLVLMGVSNGELLRGHLLSLLLLAIPAALLALLLGSWLAAALTRFATAGLGLVIAGSGPDVWVLLKALGSAVFAALLGGTLAFRREWQTPEKNSAGWWPLAVLGVCGLAGPLVTQALWGGFLSILVVGLLAVLVVFPLLLKLRQWSHRVRGLSLLSRLGVRELVWYPGDLAVAAGALALALATSFAISVMVDSFRQDFSAMLEMRMAQDLYVRASPEMLEPVTAWLAERDDVIAIDAYGSIETRIAGRPVELGFTEFDVAEGRRYGHPGALPAGECLISERLARTLGVGVGDPVNLDPGVTLPQLRVAGIFPGYGDVTSRVLVDVSTLRTPGYGSRFDRLGVRAGNPGELAALLSTQFPELVLEQRDSLRSQALRIFDQTFAITGALTLLALLVAGVALYNALLALRLTQNRSMRLLDMLGVSAGERWLVAAARSLAVGGVALFIALPMGALMGWLLCAVINPRAFGWSLHLQLSWQSLLPTVLAAVVAVAVVALLPTPVEAFDEGD